MEGSIICTRTERNRDFYGRAVSAQQLLLGSAGLPGVLAPTSAARGLYTALDELVALAAKPVESARCVSRSLRQCPGRGAKQLAGLVG